MKKNGQSAIEFLILIGVVISFFLIFLFAIQGSISSKVIENMDLTLKEIALNVINEVNLASNSVDGYYREFEIPSKILGNEYEINITDGVVFIRTLDNERALSLPAVSVVGDVYIGKNIIRKEEGVVYLNYDI